MNSLHVDDLVRAGADAWQFQSKHPELRDYFRQRYDLLRDALGVSVDPLFGDDTDSPDALALLYRSAVVAISDIPNPFGSFLAAPETVVAIYQLHRGPLGEARAKLTDAVVAVARDALESMVPGVGTRTTTSGNLVAHGLASEAPDPIDYL